MPGTRLFPSDPILLVDDQKDVMKMETVALQLAGITNVEQCSESTEVRDRLARQKYAAVLLDLYMPRLAGGAAAAHRTRPSGHAGDRHHGRR